MPAFVKPSGQETISVVLPGQPQEQPSGTLSTGSRAQPKPLRRPGVKFIRTRQPFSYISGAPPRPKKKQDITGGARTALQRRPRRYSKESREKQFSRWLDFRWGMGVSGGGTTNVWRWLERLGQHPDANVRGLAAELDSLADPHTGNDPGSLVDTTGILADRLEDEGHPASDFFRRWYNHATTEPQPEQPNQQSRRPRRYAFKPPEKKPLTEREKRDRMDSLDRWLNYHYSHDAEIRQHISQLSQHPEPHVKALAKFIADDKAVDPKVTYDDLYEDVYATGILADALEDESHPSAQFFRDWYNHAITPPKDPGLDVPSDLSPPPQMREGPDEVQELSRKRYAKRTPEEDEQYRRWVEFWLDTGTPLHDHFFRLLRNHENPAIRGLAEEIYSGPPDGGDRASVNITGILADALDDEGDEAAKLFRDWHNHAITRPKRQELSRKGRARRYARMEPSDIEKRKRSERVDRWFQYLNAYSTEYLQHMDPLEEHPNSSIRGLAQSLRQENSYGGDWHPWVETTGVLADALQDADHPSAEFFRRWYDHAMTDPRKQQLSRGRRGSPRNVRRMAKADLPSEDSFDHARWLRYFGHNFFIQESLEELRKHPDSNVRGMAQSLFDNVWVPYNANEQSSSKSTPSDVTTSGMLADLLEDLDHPHAGLYGRWFSAATPQNPQQLQRRKLGRRAPAGGLIHRGLHYPGGRYMPSKRYLPQPAPPVPVPTPDTLPLPRAAGPWSHLVPR